jgi:hypothetical protein
MSAAFQHYLTYQHNVQRYFRDHSDKYQGVIIPLSISTTFPSGTYGFTRALLARTREKQYAIDPRTPLFQKNWDRGKHVRDPHRRVAEVFGEAFAGIALKRALKPRDFDGAISIEGIVKECLEYQRSFCSREEDVRKLRKYKKLLGLTEMDELGDPQFLIPPYFQFNRQDDAWYQIAFRCIQAASKFAGSIPVRPVIHFQNWSSIVDWKLILNKLTEQDIEGFWLYPNDYKERDANVDSLKAYRASVEAANSDGFKTYSLFGGYYAILMRYTGLCGFANGIGYGEWRDSGYHRGGSAQTRVYSLRLHRYIDAPALQNIIDKDREYFGNDTEIMSGCIESHRSVDELTNAECLDHFIECRKQELDFVETHTIAEAISELKETFRHLSSIGPLEEEKFGTNLQNWWEALS